MTWLPRARRPRRSGSSLIWLRGSSGSAQTGPSRWLLEPRDQRHARAPLVAIRARPRWRAHTRRWPSPCPSSVRKSSRVAGAPPTAPAPARRPLRTRRSLRRRDPVFANEAATSSFDWSESRSVRPIAIGRSDSGVRASVKLDRRVRTQRLDRRRRADVSYPGALNRELPHAATEAQHAEPPLLVGHRRELRGAASAFSAVTVAPLIGSPSRSRTTFPTRGPRSARRTAWPRPAGPATHPPITTIQTPRRQVGPHVASIIHGRGLSRIKPNE